MHSKRHVMNVSDLPRVCRLLESAYKKTAAPIVDLIQTQGASPFHILVATVLSARTKDQTTAGAIARLFKVVKTPADLREIPVARLERLIFPVGFFRVKARHLKQMPDVLDREFQGRIPDTIDELCHLPGVGRKTANLVVALAFDKPGICVDVHVHRISNRLGLVRTDAPLKTEMALRTLLPRCYWKRWNRLLVAYGQTVCTPARPRCSICCVASCCSRCGVTVAR